MKHLLIILISILLLSSPVIGDNHKGETLYGWGNTLPYVWKGVGDKETHPKYEGDVENGKPNWVCFLTSPNGGKYIGEWKNGERTGPGTYTWSNGDKYVGEYKDEKPWNGTYYDKDGNIVDRVVNGNWIKQ